MSMRVLEELLADTSSEHKQIAIYADTSWDAKTMRGDVSFVEYARLLIRAWNRAKTKWARTFVRTEVGFFTQQYKDKRGYRITEKKMSILSELANTKP